LVNQAIPQVSIVLESTGVTSVERISGVDTCCPGGNNVVGVEVGTVMEQDTFAESTGPNG
jgi:hypothetical protein